ncbi:CRISPR-associated helicase/endonuclease Cas3 [Corynebacterium auriscanis]|uniref:CRISPR-associated protein n=1 Tax=Corynebacterium auriscanis TaxID=99807 RepID=A0A0A2DKQ0_9CORY|nr:CRISPR-associated helicase/endonuclease Cas3 [Corynebacterium auriscanis]KGM18347.1 CRISPR-associated protein [Corynebacterium auriscanis]WJY73770.1 CRISPR-associated nuclease/helicase Cas3 [Corynebacterium auriscanis]
MQIPPRTVSFCVSSEGWVAARSTQAQYLWAKSGDGVEWLSLPQHMLDSACAASLVFHRWLADSVKDFLCSRLRFERNQLEALYLWLAGIHDVGKASMAFQGLVQNHPQFEYLVSQVKDAGLNIAPSVAELNLGKLPHNVASGVIVSQWLQARGWSAAKANGLGAVLNAHHGRASHPGRDVEFVLEEYPEQWKEVQRELLKAMEALTGVGEALEALSRLKKVPVPVAQLLSGLVIVADWIASNEKLFELRADVCQRERVKMAARGLDLTAPWAPDAFRWENVDAGYQSAFSWPEEYRPRGVQRAVVEAVRDVKEPVLVVIEAETGVGKTEAGLAAAEILAARNGAQGLFFAAPSMTTANGLLERTIEWARTTAEDGVRSMYLAHSKNALAQPYQDLRFKGIEQDGDDRGNERKGTSHGVVASQWMSGRRLGLLSNIVVGTIDQVLMMALQQRFSMLRHAGLAGKVIIFDEVHAFDVYTSDYLCSAIEWLRYYGASVVLMSATLPPAKRRQLVESYSEGEWESDEVEGYPLVTVASESAVRMVPVEPSPTTMKTRVEVMEDSEEDLLHVVDSWLTDGGCLLIICNTIARAQTAYRLLSARYRDEVELLHAGFMAWERAQKEDELRARLGPDAHRGRERPRRAIVVATQVAEQSLDIDADALITDIAPMDLIIQRMGRVHRHRRPVTDRPPTLAEPRVAIRGLLAREPCPEFDPGAEAIYGRALLLATMYHLPEVFCRPDDIEKLVRAAYGTECTPPAGWEAAWEEGRREAAAKELAARRRAASYRIPLPESAEVLADLFVDESSGPPADDEERGAAQVRDAEPTVEAIPIMVTDYGYHPLGWEQELLSGASLTRPEAYHLASSTVRLPARMTRHDGDFEAVVSHLESATPAQWSEHPLLRGQLALPLALDGTAQIGRFLVRYSSELGLECE